MPPGARRGDQRLPATVLNRATDGDLKEEDEEEERSHDGSLSVSACASIKLALNNRQELGSIAIADFFFLILQKNSVIKSCVVCMMLRCASRVYRRVFEEYDSSAASFPGVVSERDHIHRGVRRAGAFRACLRGDGLGFPCFFGRFFKQDAARVLLPNLCL